MMSSVLASHGGQTKEVLGEPRENPRYHRRRGKPTESQPWQLKTFNHGEAAANSALKFLKVNVETISFWSLSILLPVALFCQNNATQRPLSDPQNVETFSSASTVCSWWRSTWSPPPHGLQLQRLTITPRQRWKFKINSHWKQRWKSVIK